MAGLSEHEIKTAILDLLRTHVYSQNYPRTDFQIYQLRAVAPENNPSEVLAVTWSLVADGIIAPGMRQYIDVPQGAVYRGGGDQYSISSVYVTEFGKRFLAERRDQPTPLEGERYRKAVTERMPDASEVIVRYVDEAMATYESRHHLAATVLIGVAAEEVAERLYRALGAHLDETRQKSFEETMHRKRGSATEKLEQFTRTFKAHQADLDESLRRRIDTYLVYLVNVLKLSRDDAGHAQVARVDREVAFMMLVSFPVLVGIVVEIEAALAEPCTLTV
jgi:hypothetical protein